MPDVTPCLWFDREAEEAARFYTSLLPDSRIDEIQRSPADWPAGKAGDVVMVTFTVGGRRFLALNGGGGQPANFAVSLSVECRDQAEVDRLWDGLLAGGGQPIQCGWLRDRYGFAWQVVPEMLPRLISDPDRAKARRVMEAMFDMVKLDVAALEKAAAGAGRGGPGEGARHFSSRNERSTGPNRTSAGSRKRRPFTSS